MCALIACWIRALCFGLFVECDLLQGGTEARSKIVRHVVQGGSMFMTIMPIDMISSQVRY